MPTMMTCDSANKRIRQLITDRNRLLDEERQSMTYGYVQGEEPYIPSYNFNETQKRLSEINDEIIRLKHAVNIFNTTHKVPGTELTIDQALVRLPMLTDLKGKLERMRNIQPKTRRVLPGSSASEFTVRNFETEDVDTLYDAITKEIIVIQQGLSTVNLTIDFQV